MIQATQEGKHCFLVRLDVPDAVVIQEIARGYGIKSTDALVSCINKGVQFYGNILHEIAEHETRKRNGG